MLSYTIRIISKDDPLYQRVWTLRDEVLRKPLGLTLRAEDLGCEVNEIIIIAIDDRDEVIGCVMLKPLSREEVKLRQMAVAQEHQGKGIGQALVRKAEEMAREKGFSRISMHARQYAIPFYERAGYHAEGDIFSEVGIPHLSMRKQLHESV
jgi:predicted N-acetyltransferase YhbS